MESSIWMNIAVVTLALLLLLQTFLIALSTYHLRRQLRLLDRTLSFLSEHFVKGLSLANRLLMRVEAFMPKIPEAGTTLAQELDEYTRKAKSTNEFLARRVDLLRYRFREWESRLNGILDAASRQAYTLQRVALYPSLGLSSMARSGIGLAKRAIFRRDTTPTSSEADIEGFI